jgi:hypothetical protein
MNTERTTKNITIHMLRKKKDGVDSCLDSNFTLHPPEHHSEHIINHIDVPAESIKHSAQGIRVEERHREAKHVGEEFIMEVSSGSQASDGKY